MFGFKSDEVAPRLYWGARAIWRSYSGDIDLLWDRQSHGEQNERQPDKQRFFKWLNTHAMPRLRRWSAHQSGASDAVFELCEEGCPYVLKASPQSSHGYLYIGAWARERVFQDELNGRMNLYHLNETPTAVRERPNGTGLVVKLAGQEVIWSNAVIPAIGAAVRTEGFARNMRCVVHRWFIDYNYAGVEIIPTHLHLDHCRKKQWCFINPMVFGAEIKITTKQKAKI